MDFIVPKLSATMETATVLRWLKQPGEGARMGEAIVELETDKAAIEVEAPADVTLEAIVAQEGAKLPIGGLLARLRPAGAAAATSPAPAAKPEPAKAATAAVTATATRGAPPPRLFVSPLARRLAGTHGIELAGLRGSGPHGRIRKRDILAAVERRGTVHAPAREATLPAPLREIPAGAARPLPSMRIAIADAVSASRRTIPSFALDRWVESTALDDARTRLAPGIERASGVAITVTDLLLQALADTLASQRSVLDRWGEIDGRPVRLPAATIDIGLVVAIEDGMMIPALRDLEGKSLGDIARLRRDAVQRVRSGRLLASDSAPVAITLSNLGRGGADRFEAIINPGQASILAVGRERERVIARGGLPVVAKGFTLTFSVDHRLIDGVRGANFLGLLADRIEFGPWGAG